MAAPHPKFGHVTDSGDRVPHDYGNVYFRQPVQGGSCRLVIGPSAGHTELMARLVSEFSGSSYYILYVLVEAIAGRDAGRYQSPILDDLREIGGFLRKFAGFFESDGRHHLWVGSADSSDLLVYDQHNVIFAYGCIDSFEEVLKGEGFKVAEFWFPVPHSHSFRHDLTQMEDELMAYYDWNYSPLQPGDEW